MMESIFGFRFQVTGIRVTGLLWALANSFFFLLRKKIFKSQIPERFKQPVTRIPVTRIPVTFNLLFNSL
jgi:hypothetical protein